MLIFGPLADTIPLWTVMVGSGVLQVLISIAAVISFGEDDSKAINDKTGL